MQHRSTNGPILSGTALAHFRLWPQCCKLKRGAQRRGATKKAVDGSSETGMVPMQVATFRVDMTSCYWKYIHIDRARKQIHVGIMINVRFNEPSAHVESQKWCYLVGKRNESPKRKLVRTACDTSLKCFACTVMLQSYV
eukprot:1503651-Amphidinium_carterae.3